MRYITLTDSYAEVTISRSRFMAFAYRVESEEDVMEKLKSLRKTYHDATHVCYAAIWDELGNMSRFSDDGEPSGTAGAPIMEVIKGAGLKKCMVAVVRYFGGVKLGTGGLTRAYSSVSADCIAKSKKVELIMCDIYRCNTDFATFKKLSGTNGISDISYTSDVSFTYACPIGDDITPLIDRTNGKLNYVKNAQSWKQLDTKA
ncbi:MAG: YigZ family protein [Clostridiales bacterium]|nr:YigZ family protein [Clostridiales bacterium]